MSFIISAPSSGAGKTTVTLGLLRALAQDGHDIRGAKSGPDYIDPRFHAAACGHPCLNLDAWAMSPARIRTLAHGSPLVVEGAMGLFDGAPPNGIGATADLARHLNLPVVLVIDASRMAQSVAPIVKGFALHDPAVRIHGVILNNVGSIRHETMLRDAIVPTGIAVIGAVHRCTTINQPSRHLGLVQAQEHADLGAFLDAAADLMRDSIDFDALPPLTPIPAAKGGQRIPPPGQRIAIAQDEAFAFAYPHMLNDWQTAGTELRPFSPLADEPVPEADFIFLPGGYPELYAGQLAQNTQFFTSLRKAAQSTPIYGECGGYMVLGKSLIDTEGHTHRMAGLLELDTSFADRKRHLGYRQLHATDGPFVGHWSGHEFHYATTIRAEGTPLFKATDATGTTLPPMGLLNGRVSGSFAHIIDAADPVMHGHSATP